MEIERHTTNMTTQQIPLDLNFIDVEVFNNNCDGKNLSQ